MKYITAADMRKLQANIGKVVRVNYWIYGDLRVEVGELKKVTPFTNIEVGATGIPFVGYGCAIRDIYVEAGTELYHNPHGAKEYDVRTETGIDNAMAKIFGAAVMQKFRATRAKYKEERAKRTAAWDARAQKLAPSLLKRGLKFILPEKKKWWEAYIKKNTRDGYSCAVVQAVCAVGEALTAGKTPAQAKKVMCDVDGGITRFQSGCVAGTIAAVHPRGGEFRSWWNNYWGCKDGDE